MLCRMLTISSSSPLRSSPLLGHSGRSQAAAAEEASMETLCLRTEEVEAAEEDVVWAEFSVDELLNFEFVENEKEDDDTDEIEEQKEVEESNSSSSPSSSAVDCFVPPLGLHGIGLPAHDAEEFEWVSLIMDDSRSEFPSPPPLAAAEAQSGEDAMSRSPTSASPAVCILSTEAMVPVKAKRSKRSRSGGASAGAGAWSMSGPRLFPDSASDSTATSSSSMSSCSSPSMASYLIHHLPPPAAAGQSCLLSSDGPSPLAKKQKKRKRGRKPKPPASASAAAPTPGERRCAHCGSQKTPQWRAGPLGAKTLCNACGVRFKSGRLLPEYRPACSPTFVSHIHSNCHRKVLEMRRNKEGELPSTPAPPPPPVQSF